MKVDIPYKFGQTAYLVNDIDQVEHIIHRIILEPKGKVTLELMNPDGDYFEVPENFVSTEFDTLKKIKKEELDD